MNRCACRIALAAAIALCAAVPPAGADESSVAVEPGGRAHFLSRPDVASVVVQRQEAGGALDAGAVVRRAPAGRRIGQLGRIGVDATGRETVVWEEIAGGDQPTRLLLGRRRAADGTFGPVRTLATSPSLVLGGVDVNARGNTVIAWSETVDSRRAVMARRWGAAGTLSPIQSLSGYYPSDRPQVAVDPAGNAVIAYFQSYPFRIAARRLTASGALGPVRALGSTPSPADDTKLDLDIADDGTAVAAWERSARALAPNGTLGPLHTLTGSRMTAGPDIDVAPDGSAVVAFAVHRWEDVAAVELRHLSPSGALSPLDTIAAYPDDYLYRAPFAEFDAGGNATVFWRSGYDNGLDSGTLYTRRRLAGGALGSVAALTPPGGWNHALGVAADGTATFLFSQYANGKSTLGTRRRLPDDSLSPFASLATG